MPCCILAAFLFGLVVRAIRRARGKDPEPVPTFPRPEVRVTPAPVPAVLGPSDHRDDGRSGRDAETAAELETVDA